MAKVERDRDVLINKDGAQTGKVGLYQAPNNFPACINEHLFLLRGRRHLIDQKYLYYSLLSQAVQQQIRSQISGSAQPGLKSGFIKGIIADIPRSLPEQTKIAGVLSTVDRAIEQSEALIAKQQRIKTGLMQDLLTRGIDEHGNLRSEETHEFKDSPLGRIPGEWEVDRLGTLLDSINQGWSPDCDSDPADIGNWGVLKTTAIVWQGFRETENKALPVPLNPRPSLEVKSGDLLMTRAGPNSRVGVVAYVYSTRSKLMLSDKMYRLIPGVKIDGRFLCYALSGFQTQRHLSNLKTGMAESQTNISQAIVKALLTVCPPASEQRIIADCLDLVSNESNQSLSALAKLRSLKTALIQDLLTGEKRVTPLLEAEQAAGSAP